MAWGQAIIAFILGAFFGPWLLAMFTGKNKSQAAY
jgi:hypothetical protein